MPRLQMPGRNMRAKGKTRLIQRNRSNRLSRMSEIVVHRTMPSDIDALHVGSPKLDRRPQR
ncbi:hypothetical protein IE4872_PC00143 (plasmid) [Rhizobium gallicum]|uniref:Uncharacterized protein n=1 Tax=Rhizobium gallicum TaxID=56730 RepID=A0A1L5NQL9_9HYPH|nr:hypothetical protein IE4872_PC00143 [Rhizobium gallicum]